MEKKSIKKNYVYNLSYQILLLITPLITTPYISRVLGAGGVGKISFSESVAAYFVLFAAMGIATYGQREISYVQDSPEKRSIVFWNTKILSFVTSLAALLVYLIFAMMSDNKSIYLILSFNILSTFADITWFFQGLEEFGKVVLRNVIFKLINIAYIFIMVKTKDDLLLYVLGISFFPFLSSLSLWGYLPKYIKPIKKSDLNPFKDIKVVLSLFVPTIAIQVYTVLDKTMIGVITDNSFENGYYDQALKISKMVLTVVTALGTVMIPRIGFYFEKKETEKVKSLMYRVYRFVWFLGIPMCLGLITVSSNFVPWFFGEGYDKVVPLLGILSFLILAIGINNVTGMQYLIPTKRQNTFTITVVIGACINFVMNIILITLFQSIGAAIASVLAEAVIAIVQLIIVRKELSPVRVLKESLHYWLSGAIMAAVVFVIAGRLSPSIVNTMCLAVIGGVIYMGVLLLIRDEFLLANMNQVIGKIRKK